MIGYLDKTIRLLGVKWVKYVKTFKVKEVDKDKKNQLMSFRIDDEKLLGKFKAIWNKIQDLKMLN